mgnify:CR=1 FL=1
MPAAGLLDVVHLEEKAVLLPCMHAYHHDCISKWLDRKRLCPLCKARVTAGEQRVKPRAMLL